MKNSIFRSLFPSLLLFFISFSSLSANESVTKIMENDFVIGNKEAPVTIIEYASLSCSHCAHFHLDTLPTLIEEYVDTGKVKIVFRDFPFNYPALLGSMALRCVPMDIRFQYSSALYQLQSQWVLRENSKTTQELYKIMQAGGMTKKQFNECIGNTDLEIDNETQKRILEVQQLSEDDKNNIFYTLDGLIKAAKLKSL